MYKLIKTNGSARLGSFTTAHGEVQTPGFMNVATCGAIKGALSALDLKELRCQVQLCNTYHLHLRPGDENIKKLGGLINLPVGLDLFLQIVVDFRFSHLQS